MAVASSAEVGTGRAGAVTFWAGALAASAGAVISRAGDFRLNISITPEIHQCCCVILLNLIISYKFKVYIHVCYSIMEIHFTRD